MHISSISSLYYQHLSYSYDMDSPIRSFVLRQGRISQAQRRAYKLLLPIYGFSFKKALIDLNHLFGRNAPKIIEIGFGMGETTATIAQANPDKDYLAIEVHTPGVGSLLNQIQSLMLTNVRIIQHDATEVLQYMLAHECLDGINIFFPDPWPKAKHHKRRLIQSPFVSSLCTRLKPNGYIHIATDWEDYAKQILQVLRDEKQLKNSAVDFVSRPHNRPLTKFEQRGLQLGHKVRDFIFLKN